MKAVLPPPPEGERAPRLSELPEPIAAPGEALLAVRATALNRVDLLQLGGGYPPPPGESEIPGLEAAGEIVALGSGRVGWRIGDRVAAFLAGGGHAERVAVPVGQLLPIPEGWSFEEAAALPEAAITAWTNLVVEGGLQPGESVLVSGATSGVGTFVVQLARALGATVLAAGRDAARLERTRALGATATIVLDDRLPERTRELTSGRGVDLILDLVGGAHLPRLVAALAPRGRLILLGLMAGGAAELDLTLLLRKGLSLRGSVLRPRSREEKTQLVAGFLAFAAPLLAARTLLPVIDSVYPFDAIADAYAHLERSRPFGKVVVRM